ncbi:MAG: hypothetical protein WCJ30_23885 [Deltaproteobacteria bacterium]
MTTVHRVHGLGHGCLLEPIEFHQETWEAIGVHRGGDPGNQVCLSWGISAAEQLGEILDVSNAQSLQCCLEGLSRKV